MWKSSVGLIVEQIFEEYRIDVAMGYTLVEVSVSFHRISNSNGNIAEFRLLGYIPYSTEAYNFGIRITPSVCQTGILLAK